MLENLCTLGLNSDQYLVKLFEGPLAFSFDSSPKNHNPRIGGRYHPDELISRTLRSNVTLLHNLCAFPTVGKGDYGTVLYRYCVSFSLRFGKRFLTAAADAPLQCCSNAVVFFFFSFFSTAIYRIIRSEEKASMMKSFYPFRFTSHNSFKA